MGRSTMKHTTVNLYEDDVVILQQKGIPISDALRELVHYLCENDITDILKSVKYGQLFNQLTSTQAKLESLIERKDDIERQIQDCKNHISFILECQSKVQSFEDNQERIDRICAIGRVIDNLMYNCNYNPDAMRRANIPELEEMEMINPGWSLEEHIKMRKAMGDGSRVSLTQ